MMAGMKIPEDWAKEEKTLESPETQQTVCVNHEFFLYQKS